MNSRNNYRGHQDETDRRNYSDSRNDNYDFYGTGNERHNDYDRYRDENARSYRDNTGHYNNNYRDPYETERRYGNHDDRTFFERAGDRIRDNWNQTWNDGEDRDRDRNHGHYEPGRDRYTQYEWERNYRRGGDSGDYTRRDPSFFDKVASRIENGFNNMVDRDYRENNYDTDSGERRRTDFSRRNYNEPAQHDREYERRRFSNYDPTW